MITLENISKIFNNEYLLSDVNLTINCNQKIGIVGKNGSGKSTLLKIIEDDDYATDGYVKYSNHTLEFLDQEKQLSKFVTINDVITDMKKKVNNLKFEIDTILNDVNFSDSHVLQGKYGELENRYSVLGGYEIDNTIDKILSEFGFDKSYYNRIVSSLSGGEKTRLALVKIIINDPDFLILDEPTNHLDVHTIEWLESYLKYKSKGVIIVSHDRFFLQRVVDTIVDVDDGTITTYNMDYKNFLLQKELRQDIQMRSYLSQQDEIKKLHEFVNKNNKRPNKIGQVNDRKKKLEQMVIVKKPIPDNKTVDFEIDGFRLKKASYIDIINAKIGYDETLINNLNLTINGGDRIGIVGENGSGKSTLIKTITKQIPQLDGRIIVHPKINIGYFDQEYSGADTTKTVYDAIFELMSNESKTMIRKHLAKFLFFENDIYKKIQDLSGGEKVRFTFAKFVLKKYDLLIMDEPTNHLDLKTKEELEKVLQQYKGTIIVVSHDRYFLNQIVNKILYVHNGTFSIYEGDYEEYITAKETPKIEVVKNKKTKVKFEKKNINQNKKTEKGILETEQKIKELIEYSASEEMYSDWEASTALQNEIAALEIQLEQLYESLVD